jgi:hypothetical protein
LKAYVLRLGVLDGAAGYAVARYQATTTYRRYRKAWRAQREAA